MRRTLSWIAIFFALGAFCLLCLIWVLKVDIIIPLIMFVAAFVLLGIVKRMRNNDAGISQSKPDDSAFFDDDGAGNGKPKK